MKTKIVYCLASSGRDYYYEQLFISVHSLRKHNPEACVEVVCDDKTYATLVGTRAKIFELVTDVVSVALPESMEQWERSRYIKTHMRTLVQGDYLFIDVDTIICSSLKVVDDFDFDIGAVKDEWNDKPVQRVARNNSDYWANQYAQKANVSVVGLHHFNSGVMYVKDTPIVHSLYEQWAINYEKYKQKIKQDQLSLMLANKEVGNVVVEMNRNLNCLVAVKTCAKHIDDAIIIHYYSRVGDYISSTQWILDPLREFGTLPCTIRNILDHPKDFFRQRSRIVWGRDVDIFDTNLHTAFIEAPQFAMFVGKLLTCYVLVKRFTLRIFR